MEDLLLCFIADRASVVEDEVGLLLALHLRVSLRDERADDFFRVVEVHLAAEGLDVKRLLLGTHRHPRSPVYRGECLEHSRADMEDNKKKNSLTPCPRWSDKTGGCYSASSFSICAPMAVGVVVGA